MRDCTEVNTGGVRDYVLNEYSKRPTRELLEQIHQHFDSKWTIKVEQESGDIFTVPVGFPHIVANCGKNFKVACDHSEMEELHKLAISQSYVKAHFQPSEDSVAGQYETNLGLAFLYLEQFFLCKSTEET